jgi:competence protein ComFC
MCTKDNFSQQVCLWCLKPIYHDATLFDLLLPRGMLCYACSSKISKKLYSHSIEEFKCQSLVVYDEDIERILFRYKEDGDLPLAPSFFYRLKKFIKQHKDYVFVLMPSSQKKTKERGFFALEEMVKPYLSTYCSPLEKTRNIKQSQQTAKQRKEIGKSMMLVDIKDIKNRKIILIDDVCTTGSTLFSAYKLIAPHAKSVKAITFAYTVSKSISKA